AEVAGERSWRALACTTRARVAIAGGERALAERNLSQALACIDEGEAPLAAWRVHAACAAFSRSQGRTDEAATHQRRRRAVLAALGASLGEDPLRQVLEAAWLAARW